MLALFIFAITASFVYVLYLILHEFTYWKLRKQPHVESPPLIGYNAPVFLGKVSFPDHVKKVYENFPGAAYYGSFNLGVPNLVLKDPNLIRDVGVKNFDYFPDHRPFVDEDLDPIIGKNVFSLKGRRWRKVRQTLSPCFTATKMKFMFRLVSECSEQFVRYFEEHPDQALNVDAKDAFTRYTNDVIATAAFGIHVDSLKDRENDFYLHGKEATDLSTVAKLLKFVIVSCVPKLMRLAGVRFLPRATDRFFRGLVSATVREREQKGTVRPDMIQLLLSAKNKENGIELSLDDIIGQAFIFFFAGFETSAVLMCFLAYELAARQDIQERIFEEIEGHLGKNDNELTYELLSNMKYLDMVISETLRLYPPAVMTDRICAKEFVFPAPMEGYPELKVEVGTNLLIPIFALHRDPKYFPDPDEFIPERFSDENKDKFNSHVYLPFGLGPRKCLGNRFAVMETKALLVHILRKFTIKLTEKSKYPVVFSKDSFNVTTEGGFPIRFEERKKVMSKQCM